MIKPTINSVINKKASLAPTRISSTSKSITKPSIPRPNIATSSNSTLKSENLTSIDKVSIVKSNSISASLKSPAKLPEATLSKPLLLSATKTPPVKEISKVSSPVISAVEEEKQSQTPNTLPEPTKEFTSKFIESRLEAINNQTLQDRVKAIPKEKTNSFKSLGDALKAIATTEIEKAWVIFYWISQNIAYNFEGLLSNKLGDNSADGVLKSRKSVCQGYATLFKSLAEQLGLQAEIVLGYAKAYGYEIGMKFKSTDHAWNAVKLGEDWYLLDSTWGTGSLVNNKYEFKLNLAYFLCSPEIFYYKHFPSDVKWLLLKTPLKLADYEKELILDNGYFSHGLQLISPKKAIIEMKDSTVVEITKPDDVLIMAKLETLKGKEVVGGVLYQSKDSFYSVEARVAEKGQYKLIVWAKNNKAESIYETAMSFLVNCKGSNNKNLGFPQIYGHFNSNNCELTEPRERKIKSGQKILFSLKVPNAKEVAVVVDEKFNKLNKTGDLFEGEVTVAGKEVGVYAKLNTDASQFQGLLKYEIIQ